MNKLSFAILLASVLLAGFTDTTGKGTGPGLKGIRVLVYTKNGKGYVHQNIGAASACIIRLGNRMSFETDTSHEPASFTEANLRKYRIIVFNNTNNDVFETDEQRLALMHFVEGGGGIVGLHSASGTERNWPWFKRMLGGSFLRHPVHQAFHDIVIDATHPSTAFLPRVWAQDDECYYVKELNPDLHVLVVHDLRTVSDSSKPDLFGATFPSVWCHEFDGGRQWYSSLGHDSATYSKPDFERHILGGLQWVVAQNQGVHPKRSLAVSPSDPLPY